FEFLLMYGRRRIGKTELIKQFVKNKPHIYFLGNKTGTLSNIQRFKKQIASHFNQPAIETNDLEDIFEYITKNDKGKLVIISDEFPYLVEKDDAIPSIFQQIIDEHLKNKNIMLIICGSSISMMEDLLSYKNPLYGRKTGHLKLKNLKFEHISEFFKNQSKEELVKIYSVLGGIPFYLEKFDKTKTALQNAKEQILSKNGRLYEEVDFIFKEEFRQPDIYKAILSAIASGSTKLSEIADKTNMKSTSMDRYLKSLIQLGILIKEIPVTEKKSKKTIYKIDDNFFDFYFMFFEPNRSDLEIGDQKNIDKLLSKKYNSYIGKKFEKLVRTEFINKITPFQFTKKGMWWGYKRENGIRKEHEIDIVTLNDETKDILFIECKWKTLTKTQAEKIISDLKQKSTNVIWNNETRKEHFGIIAKKIENKFELKQNGILAYDLTDF
ncbi:MAG: ATP-binding protein, partial [Candidatus Aenigmarchaeota archaeon]|nr:ATP-binding protein [Candidatus Aenigmarchaeota archaeon]